MDGVTATALLVQALGALGANVRGYIPNRFDEGYGLNKDALDTLKADGVKLVITVDCGIRSPTKRFTPRPSGWTSLSATITTLMATNLPSAFAVINPKQHGDPYTRIKTWPGLALPTRSRKRCSRFNSRRMAFRLNDLLDLVALGTVADLAPLVGENRVLVRRGLGRSVRQSARDSSPWQASRK